MKTKVGWKVIKCLLVGVFITATCSHASALSFVDYLPSQQGWEWVYKSTTDSTTAYYSISGTRNINGIDAIVYNQSPFGEFYFINDINGFNIYGADNNTMAPSPITIIGSNFDFGDTFTNSFDVDILGEGINNITLETSIIGFESINVPAYTGEALKVKLFQINNTKEADFNILWRNTEYAWFASDIGLIKSTNDTTHNDFVFGHNMELENYSAPVPEPATMLLFGTGIAGLLFTRIRKKRK